MGLTAGWQKESGARLEGSRGLDSDKLQAPGIVRLPSGGYRLFYTGVGPEKPFPLCQGYILSAVSDDGLTFRKEPGIRVAPQPHLPHLSRRALAPSVTAIAGGRWRMYFEARGTADRPTVICSALSDDLLHWELEEGIRLASAGGVGGPRYLPLAGGGGRLHVFSSVYGPGGPASGPKLSMGVVSAITSDGLKFEFERGYRMRDKQGEYDAVGITAAEVIPPRRPAGEWTMLFSAWQDIPQGKTAPLHPSRDSEADANGANENFAAASIATDLAGYRSRIFAATSPDGLRWGPARCIVEGDGFGSDGLDAIHAEDMSAVRLEDGRYRMYYAACDRQGRFRIASAISAGFKAAAAPKPRR